MRKEFLYFVCVTMISLFAPLVGMNAGSVFLRTDDVPPMISALTVELRDDALRRYIQEFKEEHCKFAAKLAPCRHIKNANDLFEQAARYYNMLLLEYEDGQVPEEALRKSYLEYVLKPLVRCGADLQHGKHTGRLDERTKCLLIGRGAEHRKGD